MMTKEEINQLCNIDYGKEMTFVALYKNILRGMMTIKKQGKEFEIQQKLYTRHPELINKIQRALLDAVVDYTTDER